MRNYLLSRGKRTFLLYNKRLFKRIGYKQNKDLLILLALVLAVGTATFLKGGWQLTVSGIKQSGQLFQTVWLYLILGFILGGLIQRLTPSTLIARWMGHASGIKGIFIGAYMGTIVPGGPWVFMPIYASIYGAGAAAGPIIALFAGRSMLSLQMLVVWQIPFLGVEISLAKYIACLFLPPIIGFAGRGVFQLWAGKTKDTGQNSQDEIAGNSAAVAGEEKK